MTRKFVKKLGGSFFARRLEGGVYIEGFPAVSPKCHLIIFLFTLGCALRCVTTSVSHRGLLLIGM